MSSMRFLAVKWGFKARHRGDDHDYLLCPATPGDPAIALAISLREVGAVLGRNFVMDVWLSAVI